VDVCRSQAAQGVALVGRGSRQPARATARVLGSRGTAALAGAAQPLSPPHALLHRCLACPPAGAANLRALHRQGPRARGRGPQRQVTPP